jgi:hypothetical protein
MDELRHRLALCCPCQTSDPRKAWWWWVEREKLGKIKVRGKERDELGAWDTHQCLPLYAAGWPLDRCHNQRRMMLPAQSQSEGHPDQSNFFSEPCSTRLRMLYVLRNSKSIPTPRSPHVTGSVAKGDTCHAENFERELSAMETDTPNAYFNVIVIYLQV